MKVDNHPEADKSEAYETALEHLHIVKTVRKHYKTILRQMQTQCVYSMTSLLHHHPAHNLRHIKE